MKLEVLLNKIHEDISYLNSQGKQVNKIKVNSEIFENMTKLMDIEVSKDVATVFGIIIEADENIEKYAFILDEVT